MTAFIILTIKSGLKYRLLLPATSFLLILPCQRALTYYKENQLGSCSTAESAGQHEARERRGGRSRSQYFPWTLPLVAP